MIREGGRAGTTTRRDLMTGENPWNGTRDVADMSTDDPWPPSFKCSTRENPLIQFPSFTPGDAQSMYSVLT
jgi:hypothetical protein